jgi:hypothetical protein
MLEAHIVSPRGSLYYAGGTLPYDLETLRQHVRDSFWDVEPAEVCFELVIDDASVEPHVAGWLRGIAALGVQVRLFFAEEPGARRHGPRPVERDDDAASLGDPPLVANA